MQFMILTCCSCAGKINVIQLYYKYQYCMAMLYGSSCSNSRGPAPTVEPLLSHVGTPNTNLSTP